MIQISQFVIDLHAGPRSGAPVSAGEAQHALSIVPMALKSGRGVQDTAADLQQARCFGAMGGSNAGQALGTVSAAIACGLQVPGYLDQSFLMDEMFPNRGFRFK